MITTAASKNLANSICSVILTQRRNISIVKKRSLANKPLFESIPIDAQMKSWHHREYYLAPDKYPLLEWYLNGSDNVTVLPNMDYIIESYKVDVPTLYPLFFARATSEFMQDYYVGNTDLRFVNYERLACLLSDKNSINM